MRRWALAAILVHISVVTAVAAVDDGGACANCHVEESSLAATTGGHAGRFECVACHADRRPGRFGRRHRRTLDCRSCHDELRHPRKRRQDAHATRGCLPCHDAHGSPEAQLVRPEIRARGRLRRIDFTDAGGATPGGLVSPDASGTGLCEVCHRRTEFWRADGKGKPHFTEDCTLCHAHDTGFQTGIGEDSCGVCHQDQAMRFAVPNGHSSRFACARCHEPRSPLPGPEHRTIAACQSCHDTATHAPSGVGALPCSQCHEPHGTTNGWLVLETITTTAGVPRAIRFDDLAGRADGSFASASAPGSGICEVCHTATRFYRADGGGEPHLTQDCLSCHPHGQGFGIVVTDDGCGVCHQAEATRFTMPSGHSSRFDCAGCHAERSPRPGPQHRAVAACATCHDTATHAPAGVGALPCTQCHEPHGTSNGWLVLETITTTAGVPRAIRFDTLAGRADGSFASASAPGTGICEICHTATRFYRADGQGELHFPSSSCLPCHRHGQGFAPSPQ